MQATITQKLIDLNRAFYDDNAQSFSSTRYVIQAGVRSLLPRLLQTGSILDLGCGNGNLAIALHKAGFKGVYLGLDNSQGLIENANIAFNDFPDKHTRYQFKVLDLSQMPWQFNNMALEFDIVVSFATLHHIPGLALQSAFFEQATQAIKNGGFFIFSTWQPLNSPRLRARLQDWQSVDIDPDQLSPNDLLLDWRADAQPDRQRFRYVHQFDSQELQTLGNKAGLIFKEAFSSDGKEGNLGLYQIWQKPSPAN